MDVIEQIRIQDRAGLPHEYDVVLLKALLVHGAEWGTPDPFIKQPYEIEYPADAERLCWALSRIWCGQCARVMACTEQRVTVLGVGKLEDGG